MTGIVNLWDLPKGRTYVMLDEGFKDRMIADLMSVYGSKYGVQKRLGISRKTVLEISSAVPHKTRLDILLRIVRALRSNGRKYKLSRLQSKIIWIGAPQGHGIYSPKLPFDFRTRPGARFLSAISGDGSLTSASKNAGVKGSKYSLGALIYTNTNHNLKVSVVRDASMIFGKMKRPRVLGRIHVIFPFVCRDSLERITEFKGIKSEHNPHVPNFILDKEELMSAWIEQVIADEGDVRYYPSPVYERSITWRRSVDITKSFRKFQNRYLNSSCKSAALREIGKVAPCNLIDGERRILGRLGLSSIVKPIGIYSTKKGKVKLRWEIRISGRRNLEKLRGLIKIPHAAKEKKFDVLLRSYGVQNKDF